MLILDEAAIQCPLNTQEEQAFKYSMDKWQLEIEANKKDNLYPMEQCQVGDKIK